MAQLNDIALLGVDWGTTHRRAYAIDADGHCVAEHADAMGALQCQGRFPEALDQLLSDMQIRPSVVTLSGMVGSAMGWQEVPYVGHDVALQDLPRHLTPLRHPLPGKLRCLLVPGYLIRDTAAEPDVMRGEETQLLGALALGTLDGWLVLPGTHSKWVHLRQGRVTQLRTFMTGELFGLLAQHGTLAAAAGLADQGWNESAFQTGLHASQMGALSHALFVCRARVVSGDMPAQHTRAYLSGLLIGSELQGALGHESDEARPHHFHLIGTPALAEHYQHAAEQMGITLQVLDARACYLAALAHMQSHLAGSPP
jgi:2-dehydro-3-deoxygalactonokinase